MIRALPFIIFRLAGCAPAYCNDTNEDWPGVPKCAAHREVFSSYEAFIESCEAAGGKYRVGPDYEPLCEGQ